MRIPVEIEYLFGEVSLGAFLQLVPVLDLDPDTDFDFEAGIGIRYFFELAYNEGIAEIFHQS